MLKLIDRIDRKDASSLGLAPSDRLVVPWDLRCRSRFVAVLSSGKECGCALPRGQVLRGGDWLGDGHGLVVEVVAALEPVSEVVSPDAHALLRAAYHLGNRHVPLEVTGQLLRYQEDSVLDDMVRGLGLSVQHRVHGFEPEAGAYSHAPGTGHGHSHADANRNL
jgi:urease accessory protein